MLGLIIDFDLGARFGLDRFKFFPRNGDPGFLHQISPFKVNSHLVEIFINDGTDETRLKG